MVVTVRNSFGSSKSFGVGFGAPMALLTDQRFSCRSPKLTSPTSKASEPVANTTVVTTRISRGKTTKREGKDIKWSASSHSHSQEQSQSQSTGGFDRSVLNYQMYSKDNPLCIRAKSPKGTPPSPARPATKKRKTTVQNVIGFHWNQGLIGFHVLSESRSFQSIGLI